MKTSFSRHFLRFSDFFEFFSVFVPWKGFTESLKVVVQLSYYIYYLGIKVFTFFNIINEILFFCY